MKKAITVLLFSIFILPNLLLAQKIEGKKYFASKKATVNIALTANDEEPSALTKFKIPNEDWEMPKYKVDESKIIYREPANSNKPASYVTRELSPQPDTSFLADDDNGNSIPPDVNGAVGPNNLMVTLNTYVSIQDRVGNVLYKKSLGLFWKSLPGFTDTFDPKVMYDPYDNRWIMVTPSSSDVKLSRLYIGVSATSDPMGDWYMYWVDTDESNITWFDYPSFGFNKKWIAVSGNMFGGDFYSTVFVFDKKALYNGEEVPTYTRFATNQAFTPVPSFTYSPDVEDMYLIANAGGNNGGNGNISKMHLTGTADAPELEFQGYISVSDPWGDWAGEFLPQAGSSENINSVDSRMETVIYRNNKLWAVHHVFLPADNPQRAAVQWWELDTAGVVLQRGRIEDPTNEFSFAFASIAVNANEDIFIGHGVFSESQYASAGYSFKAYYDEPNTMRTYVQYKDGKAPYYKTFGGGRNRWGDYTAVSLDPVNGYDFWALQQYAEIPIGNDRWGTWWAQVRAPFSPIAGFTSDETLIPTGETVNFIDETAGVPTEWNWVFEGGEPATSTEQNPTGILYAAEGNYPVKLIATNILGTDEIIKESYITVSSTLLPEVDFSVSKTTSCLGEALIFTDLTQYSPIQWEWQFDPSNVEFVNGTGPNSQNPEVVFNEATAYSATLKTWNLNGSAEITKFNMVNAGGYTPYFKETFEPETFRSNEWEIQNPDNEITWKLYEVGGTAPGNMAMGVNMSHYYAIGQRDRLISPPINLANMNSAALDLQYAYAKRIPDISDSLIIKISADCGETWTRIFEGGDDNSGNFATHEPVTDGSFWPEYNWDWCMSGWGASCISLDLTPWAGQANIQFQFETWSAFGNPIFIDNIEISQFVGQEENLIQEENLSIFPNPSKGLFHVALPENQNISHIQLLNQLGQVIYESPISAGTNKIDLQLGLKPGIYFLNAKGNGGLISNKVVVY